MVSHTAEDYLACSLYLNPIPDILGSPAVWHAGYGTVAQIARKNECSNIVTCDSEVRIQLRVRDVRWVVRE